VSEGPGPAGPETGTEPAVRVSTLELFFDLVFVFTATQLTALLAKDFRPLTAAQVALMLGIIWWMYGGYAWLTNTVAPTDRFRRTLMLVGMGGFLTVALTIPSAFDDAGWAFGLAYFVINLVHSGLFIRLGGAGVLRAMRGLAPLNLLSSGLVLVGGFLPGPWRYACWLLAFAVMIVTPYLHPLGGFTISPAHFVERHGLVIIVTLGESIVAIGVGAAGLPVDVKLITLAVLGLTLSYLMWWVYFEGGDGGAEHSLAAVPDARRAMVALQAYGYAHFPLLLGIVAVAAGIKKSIGYAFGHLTPGQALALGGGLAIYLAGDVAYRRLLSLGAVRHRVVGAVLALATVPIGMWVAAVQILALIVLLVAMLSFEAGREGRPRWLLGEDRTGGYRRLA
jgi:low temperature requirement protein LtrA